MTWIDVTDTAIKIGLGALIGGIITILSIYFNHRNQLIQKRDERLARVLEDISRQFENIYFRINMSLFTPGGSIPKLINSWNTEKSWNKEEADRLIKDITASTIENSFKFEELIGILRLYGCINAAQTLRILERELGKFQDYTVSILEKNQDSSVNLEVLVPEIEQLRIKFYKELNKKIDNPR